jgi:hypothetical protein
MTDNLARSRSAQIIERAERIAMLTDLIEASSQKEIAKAHSQMAATRRR